MSTGNLEICLDKKTFKIMTYNVWFREDLELKSRMDALGDLIKQHCPDFICFQVDALSYELFSFPVLMVLICGTVGQEVTPYIYMLMQKSDWWQQYTCLLSHENAIQMPYYCMQVFLLANFTSDIVSSFSMNVLTIVIKTWLKCRLSVV